MTIKRVSGQYFRSYALLATNDVGRRRAYVELLRRRRQSDGRRPTKTVSRQNALSRSGADTDHSSAGE